MNTDLIKHGVCELSRDLFASVESLIAFEHKYESIQDIGPSMLPDRPDDNPNFQLLTEIQLKISDNELTNAVLKSDTWCYLFQEARANQPTSWLESNAIFCSLRGGGSTPHFTEFLVDLLRTAHLWARLEESKVDEYSVRAKVIQICGEIDTLCRGYSVNLPVINYLHGVGLPPSTRVDLNDGAILLSLDESRLPLLLDSREVYSAEMALKSGCILVEYWPIWLLVGKSAKEHHKKALAPDPDVPSPPEGTKVPKPALSNLQAAFSLTKVGEKIGPQVMSTRPLNFFSGRSVSFSKNQANLYPNQINDEELEKIANTHQKLSTSDLKGLSIALSRYRSATTSRAEPIDKIIDAAIGLESLFGDASFVNTSIAVGLANLLGNSYEDRKQIYESSKRLYGKRSKIVHGGKLKDSDNPNTVSHELLELLSRSIIAFLDEPELLALSSDERTKELAIRERTSRSATK